MGHCRRVQTEPRVWIEASVITEAQAKALGEVRAKVEVDHNRTPQVEEENNIKTIIAKYQAPFRVILIPSVTDQLKTIRKSHTSKTVSNLLWILRTPGVAGPSKLILSLQRVDAQTLDLKSRRKTIWNSKWKSISSFGTALLKRLLKNYKENGK